MSTFLNAIFGGANPTLGGNINNAGGIEGFGTGVGEGDVSNASGFYNTLLGGNTAAESKLLAPQIKTAQQQGQQQLQTSSQFGNRSGGTNAANQQNADSTRSNIDDMISQLTGQAAGGLASLGTSEQQLGLNANAQQAGLSQEQLQNFQKSILGQGIGETAGFGLGALLAMGAFSQGFNAGQNQQNNAAQVKENADMLQRQFLAKQYEQYANNIQLPDAKTDPEGYKKALDLRTKAIMAAQDVYTPEHHATFADHLHGLIFGKSQPQTSTVPVSAGAPVPPSSVVPSVATQAEETAPSGPFAHNPAYEKIRAGLDALHNHLNAAANPNPVPQILPPLSDFAAVPTPAELKQTATATQFKNAQALEKERAEATVEAARIRANASGTSTPEKAFLNSWARKNGADGYAELTPDQQVQAVGEWKKANTASTPKLQHIAGNYYDFDPVTGKRTFLAKDSDTRVSQGVRLVTNTLTGEVTEVPVTTVVSKATGQPIAGSKDNPAVVDESPVSSQVPTMPQVTTQSFQGKDIPGLVAQGNIDITKRPNIDNGDGTHSSTFSMSFGTGRGEVLVPGVGDGTTYPLRKLTTAEALDQYRKTGKNFGTFKSVKDADAYAEKLHEDQAKYGNNGLRSANALIASGNASSKKLNKGKPKSNQAPSGPKVVAHTASLLDKSDAAQYTKLAEDANTKKEAYQSAMRALQNPTASSDQELIFSWVRSNVQGAGRMTQAEYQQARGIGSWPLRIQSAYERAKTGKLPPELEQQLLADIKRASDVSQQAAANARNRLSAPISSQAPNVPQSSSSGFNWNSLPDVSQ